MGYSDDFRTIITEGEFWMTWRDWICPGELPIYGVHDHPYYFGASLAKGTTISNITVTHYDDIGCDGSTPMSVDDFEDLRFSILVLTTKVLPSKMGCGGLSCAVPRKEELITLLFKIWMEVSWANQVLLSLTQIR
mmetsp:Transcript_55436/g.66685  ORF Transcript_55436/g.66685 Transcript_55436/m.66685 type:complete len:135 (-) Transcript_55436:1039-1443(-)